jgi:hypothetical protein
MVNKITSPITPLGEIDKINEIIDELDNIDPLPSQTGQSGKYLTTNGTVPSWAEVQSLPSQTGKAGKFLQTDGTDASWESAPFRNIGEIVSSAILLTDAGLHLLDGALINGSGIYGDFVNYISDIANMARTATTISNFAQNPSNAFDGSLSTEATTGTNLTIANNAYLGQSGLTKPVKTVRIYQGGNAVSYCSSYKLQYSNNGSTWIDIQTVSGVTQQWQTVAVNDYTPTGSTHSFRILGVTFAGTQGANNWRVMELELYPTEFCGFSTEGEWQQSVTTYGVCGKFVYNSTNNTVRLPKITGIAEGTTDVTALGNLVEAGLPNITGGVTDFWCGGPSGSNISGAFSAAGSGHNYGGGSAGGVGFDFDASRSSSIYGNSTTVQPQTIKVLYYIVVATSTKTDIQVDIDEIATDLNGKADTDLTNCTNQAFIQMAKASMPSNTKVAVTVGASGAVYQAPADGWYEFITTNTATQAHYTYLVNETTDVGTYAMGVAGVVSRGYVPVKKNDYVSLGYFNSTIQSFYFVYAKGSESGV